MKKERIQELLRGYADNTLSDMERKELYFFLKDAGNEALFVDAVSTISHFTEKIIVDPSDLSILDKIYQLDRPDMSGVHSNSQTIPQSRRVHFLRRGFVRYAAAILLFLGCGAYLYFFSSQQPQQQTVTIDNKHSDINPGGNKATLTLSDGTAISLDSAADGTLAQQGSSAIIKLANGQIIYTPKGVFDGEIMMNTMTTPRGGQYQLVLPDGSKVWLNAASSITYPAVFTGRERNVKVTGEVYFEVVKNKENPFVVDIGGKSLVQVLGTSFNINSYGDEANIKTTLVEGSVQVLSIAGGSLVALTPGQQAILADNKKEISVRSNADIDQVMAWKNGFFNLQDANLKEVTQQLERWYDIQVRFEGSVPDVQFRGKMNRGVKLSTVIKWFSDLGINTRLEGKTLIVGGN